MLHKVLLTVAFGLSATPVLATEPVTIRQNNDPNSTTFWTQERLQNARPQDLLRAAPTSVVPNAAASTAAASEAAPAAQAGKAPTVIVTPDIQAPLFVPLPAANPPAKPQSSLVPQASGTSGALFTSSRLVPLAADLYYPYITTGKLFISIPNRGTASCTASVIAPRIIVTAGHCVHSGNPSDTNQGFYTNFRFIPAYRDGFAPYGTWDWQSVIVTDSWRTGGGRVPNGADYAVIELRDRTTASGSNRIGDITGWLGWQTQSLSRNHVTMLGFPGNFDNSQKIHQVTAQAFRSTSSNTVEYGSDMGGGSSGGPWIQNFGVPADGQGATGTNRIVGVTSYGPINPSVQYLGSSVLDTRFTTILNRICQTRAGNC
jgi:V8-like Glu-specific endopeptidase